MERVKTYSENGPAARDGRGIFAAALLERFPQLPVEEEGRLGDATLRENFIERVFAYRRLQDLFAGRWSAGDLVRFHTAHKMSLLAHSTTAYNQLGQLVARAGTAPRAELRDTYRSLFMQTLAIRATRARHTNVLQHMAGHLKTLLAAYTPGVCPVRLAYRNGEAQCELSLGDSSRVRLEDELLNALGEMLVEPGAEQRRDLVRQAQWQPERRGNAGRGGPFHPDPVDLAHREDADARVPLPARRSERLRSERPGREQRLVKGIAFRR